MGVHILLRIVMLKRVFAVPLAIALFCAGCGYVLNREPVKFSDAPKWRSGDPFYVFEDYTTNSYRDVCRITAESDFGQYPSWDERITIAKKFARRHGGNGVILASNLSSNALNVIRVIFVEK